MQLCSIYIVSAITWKISLSTKAPWHRSHDHNQCQSRDFRICSMSASVSVSRNETNCSFGSDSSSCFNSPCDTKPPFNLESIFRLIKVVNDSIRFSLSRISNPTLINFTSSHRKSRFSSLLCCNLMRLQRALWSFYRPLQALDGYVYSAGWEVRKKPLVGSIFWSEQGHSLVTPVILQQKLCLPLCLIRMLFLEFLLW